MTETPLYRPITAGEFLHERKMRFSPDSLEATGIPFDAISHGGTEPLTPPMPSPDWQSRLGSISQVMPLDFEGYAAILLPWVAYRGQIRYDVEGIAEAYRSFGLTVPEERSLDRIYADFGIIERSREVPALARMVLDRFAGTAKTVFVRSASYAPDEPTYWAIERKLFLELEHPFSEIPHTGGFYAIFPAGGRWYIHHPGDTPILYVAGSADLIASLLQVLQDRAVPLQLPDKYYS